MKQLTTKALLVAMLFLVASCSTTKKASKAKGTAPTTNGAEASAKKPGKNDIQPYSKVITKEAVTDKGLFDVHKIDDTYFFEIPD